MPQESVYRALEAAEMDTLLRNGCWSDDWSSVLVADGFDARRVARVVFRGKIRIGSLAGEIDGGDGIPRFCGLFAVNVADVVIGAQCHISNVRGWLSRLNIEAKVFIEDVGSIRCSGDSAFGNGSRLEVLNEGGGRTLVLTGLTSAQIAYLSLLYRHDPELVASLEGLAENYTHEQRGSRATIGTGSQIRHCGVIEDVNLGPGSILEGVKELRNGSILSQADSPVRVGTDVVARDFIFQRGARISDGALLTGALVGEATRVGRQFSGENVLLFSNSEAFHSEAVSYFGGPYSVTHHRSTLLIAAMTSFYNAGSGTNQSNHLYKLGPLHQGILERGSKTGSFSYLLWPSRVGAFSVVMGKHVNNFDTSPFPFSYINAEGDQSYLVPAMNYFTVGTLRDGAKWPQRDRRTHADVLDQLIFPILSPYTIQHILVGRQILQNLYRTTPRDQESVTVRGIRIKRLLLKTCNRYYGMILDKYFGDFLLERMDSRPKTWKQALEWDPHSALAGGTWVDAAGLLLHESRMQTLLTQLKTGALPSQPELLKALRKIHAGYAGDARIWTAHAFEAESGISLSSPDPEALLGFLETWRKSSTKLLNMVLLDAGKEFEDVIQTGYGIDGAREADFAAVRGRFEDNDFVGNLQRELEEIESRFQQARKQLLS